MGQKLGLQNITKKKQEPLPVILETENSLTFNVDKVDPCKKSLRLETAQSALESEGINIKRIEDFSHKDKPEENIATCQVHGLVTAIHFAYGYHYALKLSVSDFIILIGQGLSRHIEQNAEKLRYHFVSHDGKEKIVIRRDEFVKGEQNDWSTIFGEFAEEIKKRVKADIYGVIIDDTSVATPTTRIVSEITLMDAMKSYFTYESDTMCGIPQITLEGTPEDWQKLYDKVAKLVEMNKDDCLELKWWLDKLVPVVVKICEAGIKRRIDNEFWSGIYKYSFFYDRSTITGWITIFFPYLCNQVKNLSFDRMESQMIPKQISEVHFVWNYHGEEILMIFYGGYFGAEFDKITSTIKPACFWSVNYKETETEQTQEPQD